SSPRFGWTTPERSIGRLHSWHGNALVLARALTYVLVHGNDGLRDVARLAVLNANWLRKRFTSSFDAPYDRPCMHECVLSASSLKRATGVKALDVAKRLLEEALMIEPTETESMQTLEALASALERIVAEAATPEGARAATEAPHLTPV